jgi:hypothetical protein
MGQVIPRDNDCKQEQEEESTDAFEKEYSDWLGQKKIHLFDFYTFWV